MNFCRSLCMVTMVLIMSGCTSVYRSYPDSSLPADKVSRIVGAKTGGHTILSGLNQAVFITDIDGKCTQTIFDKFVSGNNFNYYSAALVLPDAHIITVYYRDSNIQAFATLSLYTEAGKTYTIKATAEEYSPTVNPYYRKVFFWIEDESGPLVGRKMDPPALSQPLPENIVVVPVK